MSRKLQELQTRPDRIDVSVEGRKVGIRKVSNLMKEVTKLMDDEEKRTGERPSLSQVVRRALRAYIKEKKGRT